MKMGRTRIRKAFLEGAIVYFLVALPPSLYLDKILENSPKLATRVGNRLSRTTLSKKLFGDPDAYMGCGVLDESKFKDFTGEQ